MKYVNYDPSIVEIYKVAIKGWPSGIAMVNPSEIASLEDLLTIREAWRTGVAFWDKLTKAEVKKHMEDAKVRHDTGEIVGRECKKRSDAGQKRGKRKATQNRPSDKENKRLSKRAKVSGSSGRSRPPPKSKEFIDDSNDEGDEEDEGGEEGEGDK